MPVFGQFMPTLAVGLCAGERLPVPCLQLASPGLHDRGVNLWVPKANAAEMLVHGAQMYA